MNIQYSFADFDYLIALLIFISYIVVDALYAHYTIKVSERQPVSSATTGSIIHVLIAFGVLNYVNNLVYLIPIVIGSWIGTYWGVIRNVKTKDNDF